MKTWYTVFQTRFLTIRAHYTWLLLLILGVWSLAHVVLPARFGDDTAVWLPALLIMAMYVGIVALHEAAHVVVARLLRVPMPTLNVHPIGTLARRGYEPSGPGRALAVAAAGPLANLLLWLGLRTLAAPSGTVGGELLNFARSFTLTLGLINLLPGLPLDGGRMLRASVWFVHDFAFGTRVATFAGYIVAACTLFVGLFMIVIPANTLRGVWILLLAWLSYSAGTALMRQRAIGGLFTRLTASDVMVPPVRVAAPTLTLRELVASWRGGTGENPTPVIENGRFVGLITWSLASDVPQGYWDERTVGQTMQPISELALLTPTTPLAELLPQLDTRDFNPLPSLVVDDGRLVGQISTRDVFPFLEVQEALGMENAPLAPSTIDGKRTRRLALSSRQGTLS